MHTTLNKLILKATRCYFGGGPSAPAVPKPPMQSDAAKNVNNAAFAINQRKPADSMSTILTGGQGVTNQTSKKTILGG